MKEQKKGELIIQLLRIDWNVRPPEFGPGCTLSIHWWGQSPSENLVLLIPNGSCPPSVTTIYTLVSSRIQIYRYFQDMIALEFSLVVGEQSTEENFGIRMGSFSIDISQLSDNHPIEGTIPVFEPSGVHLANTTLRISMVYDPEHPMASATKMPFLDTMAMNIITSFEHHDVEAPREKVNQVNSVTPQSPRKQLVLDVEVPLKRHLVMSSDSGIKGDPSSSTAQSSPRGANFRDKFASSSNLYLKPGIEGAITSSQEGASLSVKSTQVSPRKAEKSKKQRHTGKAESSATLSGPQSSSPARIGSQSPNRRAVNIKNGQQFPIEKDLLYSAVTIPGQMSGAEITAFDSGQSGKITPAFKRAKTSKLSKVHHPDNKVHSESSPEKGFKIRQRSPVRSATISKTNMRSPKTPPRGKTGLRSEGSKTTGKTKKSSKRSRPREEEEKVPLLKCIIHSEGYTGPEIELAMEQRHLDFPDRRLLSGNLAILPEDVVEKYLQGISTAREKDDTLYQELVQKLIQQIVAFRATLNKSSVAWGDGFSPSAEINKLDETKSATLVKRFKKLDRNITSVNRLLISLLTDKNYDLPQYARVAHTDILEDDPKDVADEALVEELFFPKTESELRGPSKPKTIREEGQNPSAADGCEIHNEGTPKMQAFVEGLPLRYCQANPTLSKRAWSEPLLESLYDDGVTGKKSGKFPALNLILTLKVGKLILSEPTLRESREFAPGLSENSAAWSIKQNVNISSCLLTTSFPSPNHHANARKSTPDQSISISPTHLDSSELYFGNELQFHWKKVKMQSLEIWKSENMNVSAFLSWDTGQSLNCEGSFVLGEVFNLMPKAFQTKLSLFKRGKEEAASECEAVKFSTPEPEIWTGLKSSWDEASGLMAHTESSPAARLEINIELLVEDSCGKAVTGSWLYVTVHCVTGSNFQPHDEDKRGHLFLIVKSGLQSICQIPFYSDWRASARHEVKEWRPHKGNYPDGVLRCPKQTGNATLFIEVWRNGRDRDMTLEANSKNLIGLVKVPLESTSNLAKVNEGNVVVAEGDYYIWNPFKDVLCGTVEIQVVMGSETQMLKLLQQNRAARIIQSYAPSRRNNSRSVKHTSEVAEYNSFKNNNLPKDYKRKTVKHVIEVTVQHATDLPQTVVFAKCEGTFIKYFFPCDEDAFYTQTMEWSKTVHFSASVHHGIILPSGEPLDNHFKDITESTATTGDHIFELWGCYASLSDEHKYPPNVMRLSDNGALSARDMGREPTCHHEGWDTKRRERLIGTAKLPQWSLLVLIAAKPPLSPQVRKIFYLPIQVEASLLKGSCIRAPTLAVEVAYFTLNQECRKKNVKDTIFSEVSLSEDSLFEGVVEFDIIQAAGLQDAQEIYDLATANYFKRGGELVRSLFSFSSNEELDLKYPPRETPVQPNSCGPLYKWTGHLKLDLNIQVLKELRCGHMSFGVWHHHFPEARSNAKPVVPTKDSLTTDVLLGTTLIPTRTLLESKQGIEGWHDLISRKGKKVGAINVHVYFKDWRVRPLGFRTLDTRFQEGGKIPRRPQSEGNTWKL